LGTLVQVRFARQTVIETALDSLFVPVLLIETNVAEAHSRHINSQPIVDRTDDGTFATDERSWSIWAGNETGYVAEVEIRSSVDGILTRVEGRPGVLYGSGLLINGPAHHELFAHASPPLWS
jgi:hypothetical protein